MITTSLQDQIKYLDRTRNPNYIIIVQNKAGENMDFSKFEPVIPKMREVYKPKLRYEIKVIDSGTNKLILVKDT